MYRHYIKIIHILLLTTGWGQDDPCTMPDHSLHLTSGGSVLYNSSTPMAGFQFDVDGAGILATSGGDAGAAGYMISFSESFLLGFSLSGVTIDGCGTLVELELDGEASGLSSILVADSGGQAIPFEYFDGSSGGDVEGCMDMDACNYNADATMDDGSCDYGTMCWDGSYECDASDCPDEPDGWDGDACSMPDHTLHVTSGGSVLYNSSTPLAGFQFDVDGTDVLGASGGDAQGAAFIVNINS
ncbi:uncharacterized protein METZ01_LOCUS389979, partial [marine metagenome]